MKGVATSLTLFSLFLISSVKYILFGLGKTFNTINFHSVQFTAFNNYFLLDDKHGSISYYIKLSLLTLFGLFPHDDNTLNSTDATSIITFNKNITVPYTFFNNLEDVHISNTTQEDIKNAINWIDYNMFLTTLIILSFIFISAITFKVLCYYFFCSEEEESDVFDNRRWKKYYSFVFRILLIAYCNLSTMIIYQLINMTKEHMALNFLAVLLTIVYIIGFPIYIYIVLNNRNHRLYEPLTRMKYGPFYELFKRDSLTNKFIIVILLKELCYSIVINSGGKLGVSQNTVLIFANFSFFLIMLFKNPYYRKRDRIISVIMSLIICVITTINYIFIFDHLFSKNVLKISSVFGYVLHIITILISVITSIYSYCKKDNRLLDNESIETTELTSNLELDFMI